jgi:hypothetical protein
VPASLARVSETSLTPMCFSPEADFAAGAAVAVVGAQTLRLVRTRRELLIGSLPLLFGAHQLVEGFVWLRLRGQVSSAVGNAAIEAYLIYAHAVLPAIVPLGFLLIERDRRGSRWLWPLVGIGVLLGAYLLREVTAYPVGARELAHCVDYTTHTPNDYVITELYVLVTCGPALLSSRPYLRWFGVLSLIGVIVAAIVRTEELTSVWCLYAAFISLLILEHFHRERTSATPPILDEPTVVPP